MIVVERIPNDCKGVHGNCHPHTHSLQEPLNQTKGMKEKGQSNIWLLQKRHSQLYILVFSLIKCHYVSSWHLSIPLCPWGRDNDSPRPSRYCGKSEFSCQDWLSLGGNWIPRVLNSMMKVGRPGNGVLFLELQLYSERWRVLLLFRSSWIFWAKEPLFSCHSFNQSKPLSAGGWWLVPLQVWEMCLACSRSGLSALLAGFCKSELSFGFILFQEAGIGFSHS